MLGFMLLPYPLTALSHSCVQGKKGLMGEKGVNGSIGDTECE